MAKNDTFQSSDYGRLRYDFKAWSGPAGPIDDPSDKAIETYFDAMRVIAKKYGDEDTDTDDMTTEQLTQYLETEERLRLTEAQDEMAEAVATLCKDTPSKADLLALPFRIRQAFMRWLQRKITDPEF